MADLKGVPLHTYWERYAIWVSGITLAIVTWTGLQVYEKVETLEDKVIALQQDKVSRQELKDLDDRMDKRMESMKNDIIARLDWYFAGRKSKEP